MRTKAIPKYAMIDIGYLNILIALLLLFLNVWESKSFFSFDVIKIAIFGGIAFVILGMSYNILPLFSRRFGLYSEKIVIIELIIATFSIIFLYLSVFTDNLQYERIFSYLWLIVIIIHLSNMVMTIVLKKSYIHKKEISQNMLEIDRTARLYMVASLIYALIGALLLVFGNSSFSVVVHSYTLGFIILMIFGAGYHIFPRIIRVEIPSWITKTGLVALGAPLLLLLSEFPPKKGYTSIFLVGAVIEYTAIFVFAIVLIYMCIFSPKKRSVYIYFITSALSMIMGVFFGVLFAIDYSFTTSYLPLHAFINLFGIAVTLIYGVSIQMIFFYASLSKKTKKLMELLVATFYISGLTLASLAYVLSLPTFIILGLLLMIVGTILALIGVISSPFLIFVKLMRMGFIN